MAEKNVKKRNWAFTAWPDSLPQDWKERLEQTGLPVAISPIHDKDVNPDGTPKKAHYHVMLFYSGPTSYNVVKRLTDSLGQPIPQAVEQVRGYYRYLTHKDNPEKAQYEEKDIIKLNGFDIQDYVELTKSEVTKAMKEVQGFVMDNNILEYADLMEILYHGGEDMASWYDVVANHTLFFTAYLKSRRFRVTVSGPQDGGAVEGGEKR